MHLLSWLSWQHHRVMPSSARARLSSRTKIVWFNLTP
jgi:hypothetical protein